MLPPERHQLKSVTLNLTRTQHADLRELAERKFSTVSQVVREIVNERVEREKHADAR